MRDFIVEEIQGTVSEKSDQGEAIGVHCRLSVTGLNTGRKQANSLSTKAVTKTVDEGREQGAKGRTTVTVGPDALKLSACRDVTVRSVTRDRSDLASSLFGDHSVTCARPALVTQKQRWVVSLLYV